MTATHGRKTAKMLATDAGLSAAYVRQLVATAKAYPDEKTAADMSFSHHKTAAMTEDPEGWLQRAVADELSVKERQQAITNSRDRLSVAEEAPCVAERLHPLQVRWMGTTSMSRMRGPRGTQDRGERRENGCSREVL